MPADLFVMFMAALTTNNFLWEFLVGGNLHRQIGRPYVLWLLKVMCEGPPSACCARRVTWSRHTGQGSHPKARHMLMSSSHKICMGPSLRTQQWQKRDFAGIMGTVIFHYVGAKWGLTCGRGVSDPCQGGSCQFHIGGTLQISFCSLQGAWWQRINGSGCTR